MATVAISATTPATRAGRALVGTTTGTAGSPATARGVCALARRPASLGARRDRADALIVRAADDGADAPADAAPASDGLAFEPKSKSKRKRRDGKNTRRASIKVEGAAIEAAKGNATPTIQSASEEAYILFLLGYVVIIFLGGLLLAISAFGVLPENFDHWVTDTLYPNYSPIVIGFLVFSSIYGLVKTREDPNSASGR